MDKKIYFITDNKAVKYLPIRISWCPKECNPYRESWCMSPSYEDMCQVYGKLYEKLKNKKYDGYLYEEE